MAAINLKSKRITELCQKYNVQSLRLFGSHLHGDPGIDSDVDILVRFNIPVSLLRLVSLQRELSEILGTSVDLVTEGSLSPYLRNQILAESREIYAS
jgi:uncharacterized protein